MTPVLWVLLAVSTPMVAGTLVTWGLYPLSVLFELRQRAAPALPLNARVSVVVPAYNEGVVLRACVDSILASGYRWLEVVLVDDGSSDDTLAIMREYEGDPRVLVVAKPNGGKGSALNAGIARATGEVFVFVDADGVFTPTTIPRLLVSGRGECESGSALSTTILRAAASVNIESAARDPSRVSMGVDA